MLDRIIAWTNTFSDTTWILIWCLWSFAVVPIMMLFSCAVKALDFWDDMDTSKE